MFGTNVGMSRLLALVLAIIVSLWLIPVAGDGRLFDRLPVHPDLVWKINPFGETVWVKTHPASLYAYSDGKHGGIDFMLPDEIIPVVAGIVGGEVVHADNTGVQIKKGEYTIIYEHLQNIPGKIQAGYVIKSLNFLDGFLGDVKIDPGNTHLHLEVRKDGYIINPLPLLNSEWLQGIEFVSYEDSSESTDPYNQEPIKLS